MLDTNYCVYVYKDKEGRIRYVGEGRPHRPYTKTQRPKELRELIESKEYTIEVVAENLTKRQAQELELEIMQNNSNLINKAKTGFVKEVTYELCSKYFYIDETSPTFIRWAVRRYKKDCPDKVLCEKGDVAGFKIDKGYFGVKVENQTYYIHRVVWVLHNKRDVPTNMVVNHLDANRSNNHPSNLKLCSQRENILHIKRSPKGKTGLIGVSEKIRYGRALILASVRFYSKRFYKTFSVKKYGKEIAIEMAIAWRENKIKELNELEVECQSKMLE